jgi:hypothetical protein
MSNEAVKSMVVECLDRENPYMFISLDGSMTVIFESKKRTRKISYELLYKIWEDIFDRHNYDMNKTNIEFTKLTEEIMSDKIEEYEK